MNKKAYMESLNILIAVAVIATAFLILYVWYSTVPKEIGGKIAECTADLKDSNTLIRLLNTPVGSQETIADLIISRKTEAAALSIKSTLSALYGPKILYVFKVDGAVIAETGSSPGNPLIQEVFLPGLSYNLIKVRLEFGI